MSHAIIALFDAMVTWIALMAVMRWAVPCNHCHVHSTSVPVAGVIRNLSDAIATGTARMAPMRPTVSLRHHRSISDKHLPPSPFHDIEIWYSGLRISDHKLVSGLDQ